MLSERALSTQVGRLMGLPFAPTDRDGIAGAIAEFKRVLRSGCKSDAHLVAVVDHIMDSSPRIPPPAEVLAACAEVRPTDSGGLPAPCERCRDNHSGGNWIDYGLDSDGNERGWGRCNCERGQALRALDRQHANDR